MYRIIFYISLFQYITERYQGIHVRNARLEGIVDDLVEIIRPRRQHHNRNPDSCILQFHPLYRIGNRKIIGTGLLHHPCKLDRPMSVGIGLDQDKQFRVRLEPVSEISVIFKTIWQIYLQSRKIILL